MTLPAGEDEAGAAELDVAADYRRGALTARTEAARLRAQAHALDVAAADLIVLAATIERSARGIDPLPAAGAPAH
ncbi:MAG: hypothetical protein QOD63_854 [Actinomycetota bacterium]|nr:hypothetical protein [Actinomycetota bacterium]